MSLDQNDSANNAAPSDTAASGTMRIDPAWTTTLANASLAAYTDFEDHTYKPQLSGYTFVGRFKGWDDWFWEYGREERYGLIFKSQTVANRYVVAFRGTDSDADALAEAFFEFSTFKPYRNSVSPVPDDVSAGFNDIYSTMGGSMTQTMQQQIFGFLQSQQMAEVYITGHSLGGALSQLFTLDMRVSFPNVKIQTINFASPKVGGSDWGKACSNAGAAQRITRVINYEDIVPDLPLSWDIFDKYVSLGAEFRTAFYGGYLPMDTLPRHRLLNLQVVLKNCLPLYPQIWVATFGDAVYPHYKMTSIAPPSASKDQMITKLRELNSLERSIRASTSRSEPLTQSQAT
jgi:triacylglycerol lipase